MNTDLPHMIGRALRPFRPGPGFFAIRRRAFATVPRTITVDAPGFAGDRIPERFTIYGDTLSPPIQWSGLPPETRSVVLLVEDADAPSLRPLGHAIIVGIPPYLTGFAEGAIPALMRAADPKGWMLGRNSVGRCGWLPIAPPPGHGPHRYAFQVFALDAVPLFAWPPGRAYLLKTIAPHVIAAGERIGVYERP